MARLETKTDLLDGFGKEIASIIFPVTICMAATVYLVRQLGQGGALDAQAVTIATAYYKEKPEDSDGVKFEGALLNALIFVVVIGAMTFVLAGLYWLRCYKFIYGYMAFSVFSIFFVMGGTLFWELFQSWNLQVNIPVFVVLLAIFAIVGVLTLFFMRMPTLVKQAYVITVGVITAYWFTKIPEWTTWIVLLSMALYDICAVLIPGGPLRMLVHLAQERDEPLPALVYESGPSRGPDYDLGRVWRGRHQETEQRTTIENPGEDAEQEGNQSPGTVADLPAASQVAGPGVELQEIDPMIAPAVRRSDEWVQSGSLTDQAQTTPRDDGLQRRRWRQEGEEEDGFALPDEIKLGLGDFIFYSLLVGRAAMYDILTVFSCYLAIVMGLGATLFCLALYRQALPALPFSIALGVLYYFLSRGLLEHLVVSLATNLLFV